MIILEWKRHRLFSLIAAILLCLLLLTVFWPVYILEIAYAEDGKRIFRTRIRPGDRFSLTQTHSVQLCSVKDDFEIDEDCRILLVSTTCSDHGAGLPYSLHKGSNFSIQDDGRFRISGMRAPLPEILLRVEREYDNTFIFGSRHINLSETYGDALLEVRIKKYRFPFRHRAAIKRET